MEHVFNISLRFRLTCLAMDMPARTAGTGSTVRALATAINHTLPDALEDVQRDLERARMELEDVRSGMFAEEEMCSSIVLPDDNSE